MGQLAVMKVKCKSARVEYDYPGWFCLSTRVNKDSDWAQLQRRVRIMYLLNLLSKEPEALGILDKKPFI